MADIESQSLYKYLTVEESLKIISKFISSPSPPYLYLIKNEEEKEGKDDLFFLANFQKFPYYNNCFIKKSPEIECINSKTIRKSLH